MISSAIDLLSTHIFIHFRLYFGETLDGAKLRERKLIQFRKRWTINTWKVSAGLLTRFQTILKSERFLVFVSNYSWIFYHQIRSWVMWILIIYVLNALPRSFWFQDLTKRKNFVHAVFLFYNLCVSYVLLSLSQGKTSMKNGFSEETNAKTVLKST